MPQIAERIEKKKKEKNQEYLQTAVQYIHVIDLNVIQERQ